MHDLSKLPENLAGLRNNLKFLKVWQRWRGERPLPTRDDVRPEMLGASITGITVFEVKSPDCVVYRKSCSMLDDLRRNRITGKNYIDMAPTEQRQTRVSRLNNILNLPCGGLGWINSVLSDGVSVDIQTLLLPVTGNTPTDHGFIYVGVDLISDKNWDSDATFETAPVATRFEYVDIGFGLPDDSR